MAATQRTKRGEGARRSLYNRVADDLGQRIVRGDFQPGQLLPNEAECGQLYGVSRTAVREAVKMLSAKGLINSRPKIGSRVLPRSSWNLLDRDVLGWYYATVDFASFARDVQQIRFMVEPEAAALAAANRTAQHLSEIEKAFDGMSAALDENSWNAADVKFHLSILNASGNELIVPFGRAIESMLANLFSVTVAQGRNRRDVLPLHEAILKAIRERKADAARKAALRLLENTQRTLERGKRRGGERDARPKVRSAYKVLSRN